MGSTAPTTASKGGGPQVILLAPGAGTLHETVTGSGTGPDTHTLLSQGFAAQIDTQAARGVKDTLTLGAGADEVGFATAAPRKPLTLTLLDSVSKERRTAQIATMSFRGVGDTLAFTGSKSGLTFTHHGAATTFSLTLSALGPKSAPAVFQSGPLRTSGPARARASGRSAGMRSADLRCESRSAGARS